MFADAHPSYSSTSAAASHPRTQAEAAYRALRDDILWGRLQPNAPLRSDALRQNYKLGISPLREALTRLAADGLVTAIGQRGFRVAPLLATDVAEVTRLRILIEGDALRQAIAHGDGAWEIGVVSTLHALASVPMPVGPGPEAETWARHHQAFHRALIDAGRVTWSSRLAELLYFQAERYRTLYPRGAKEGRRNTGAEHQDIGKFALARDADAAASALTQHYQRTADLVLRHLTDPPK